MKSLQDPTQLTTQCEYFNVYFSTDHIVYAFLHVKMNTLKLSSFLDRLVRAACRKKTTGLRKVWGLDNLYSYYSRHVTTNISEIPENRKTR